MNTFIELLIVIFYLLPSALLMLFGLNLYFSLFLCVLRFRRAKAHVADIAQEFAATFSNEELPPVVTQIPVYNEFNVIERSMRAAAEMIYPAHRHTIQVLDDSTDETRQLIDRVAADLQGKGHDVQVVRRPHRQGFKAGALAYGMTVNPAAYFAIFDADFVPPRDFLVRTMQVLMIKPEVGMVQARWGHLNERASLLTLAQGMGIDTHFAVEQPARAWNNLFMTFNGTAGLWRRQAIEDAGNWQSDTLTEDMDLSYRSQLAGWKPYYLSDLVVEGEIPENINAFKAQQFRWAKGSIQTALKLLPRIYQAPCSLISKVEATFHMLYYGIFPLMVCIALLTLPVYSLVRLPATSTAFMAFSFILVGTAFAPTILFIASQIMLKKQGWKKLYYLPVLLALGIGVAISNSRAVLEAVFGIKSEFVRTPKKGSKSLRSYATSFSYGAIVELVAGAYCFLTFEHFMDIHSYMAVPYLLINGTGFTVVGLLSVWHFVNELRWARSLE